MKADALREVLESEGGGDATIQVLLDHGPTLLGLLDAAEHLQRRGELPPVLDAWVRSVHAIGASHG